MLGREGCGHRGSEGSERESREIHTEATAVTRPRITGYLSHLLRSGGGQKVGKKKLMEKVKMR